MDFPAFKLIPGAQVVHYALLVVEQVTHEESHGMQAVNDRENPIKHELHWVADVQVAHPTGQRIVNPLIELLETKSDGEFPHVLSAFFENPIMQVVQLVASEQTSQFVGHWTQLLSAKLEFGWTNAYNGWHFVQIVLLMQDSHHDEHTAQLFPD